MAKRVYVAVGSVGVKCLIQLIARYQDEGLFKDTQDAFVGMDTDAGRIRELQSLEGSNAHITGIQVVHEPVDSPVRDLVGRFRRDWDITARIPQSGVGGDRKLSFATLQWSQNDELRRRIGSLANGDELILIGTAFGGTSTGMFWNVAMWLRANLKLNADRHRAEFYAFMVLPGDQGGDLEKYPWSYNLCAFMQDMQALDFGIRVGSRLQAEVPFAMPLFSLYDPSSSPELVPLWLRGKHGFSDHAFLPCDRIFVVPTPSAGIGGEAFIPDVVAEQAFVLGALNGWKDFRVTAQTIDLMNTSHGADYTKPDHAFGGFNMVAGRSSRRAALSSVFWKKLQEQYTLFVSKSGAKTASSEALQAVRQGALRQVKEASGTVPLIQPRRDQFLAALDDHRLTTSELAGRLGNVLKDLQASLATQPYPWVSFADFVKCCCDWIAPCLQSNPDTFVTLTDIYEVYLAIRTQIQTEATQFEEVRRRILCLPAEQDRISQSRVSRCSTRALGAGEAVTAEVAAQFKRAEMEYFDWFVSCCRAQATRSQLMDDAIIANEKACLVRSYEEHFGRVIEDMSGVPPEEALPPCIHQNNRKLKDVSNSLTVNRGVFLPILLDCVKDSVADIRERLAVREQESVAALAEQAFSRGPGNPLRDMVVDLSDGNPKAFSDVFEVGDANEWHCHFFIKGGNVAPVPWGKLDQYSPAFKTFQLLLNGAPYASEQNVEPSLLRGPYYTAKSISDSESQGAWIGTLQLDVDIRSIVKHAYERISKPINIWEAKAFASVREGAPQRSLLTLPESLAISVICGCIHEQARTMKDLGSKGCVIRIDQSGSIFKLSANEVPLFFTHAGESSCQMVNIHRDWIKPLMTWIAGSFWADVQMEDFRKRLVEMERSVLSKMTLSFSDVEFRQPLIDLASRVKGKIHVDIS